MVAHTPHQCLPCCRCLQGGVQGRQLVPQVGLLKLQPQLRPSMRLGMGAVLRVQGDAKLVRIARTTELQVGWPGPFASEVLHRWAGGSRQRQVWIQHTAGGVEACLDVSNSQHRCAEGVETRKEQENQEWRKCAGSGRANMC